MIEYPDTRCPAMNPDVADVQCDKPAGHDLAQHTNGELEWWEYIADD